MSEYTKRDHTAQGEHYLRHVSAMTGEGLHTKSAIAGELAHRDIEIERLTDDYAAATHLLADRDAQIERLMAELATLRASAASVQADQRAEIDAANAVIDELRADAERYRWLRNCAPFGPTKRPVVWRTISNTEDLPDTCEEWLDGYELDDEIDAARAALKGKGSADSL